MKRIKLFVIFLFCGVMLTVAPVALACGGLFCQNIPVDQAAERIIFTVDPDTVTAYVQINYTGNAPDFAWVVPVPSVPEVDVAEMASFSELQVATDPVFMLPPIPDCMFEAQTEGDMAAMPAAEAARDDVTVFASGEAGPYVFDVVGTETGNANALIDWLNENNYRITPEMEPLVFVYVQEEMVFLAMKLQPEQGVQNIQPVKMTYETERPMIPIRLTAVAAIPDMGIYTWIFGRAQAEAQNYGSFTISNEEIALTNPFAGSTNYLQLVGAGIDRFGGQAFITEYAQPSNQLQVVDPLLQELRQRYPYVTRLYGQMSPNEMTVDPVFDFNNGLNDMSNVRDLTSRTDLFPCQDDAPIQEPIDNAPTATPNTTDPNLIDEPVIANQTDAGFLGSLGLSVFAGAILATCLLVLGAAIGGGIMFVMRRR